MVYRVTGSSDEGTERRILIVEAATEQEAVEAAIAQGVTPYDVSLDTAAPVTSTAPPLSTSNQPAGSRYLPGWFSLLLVVWIASSLYITFSYNLPVEKVMGYSSAFVGPAFVLAFRQARYRSTHKPALERRWVLLLLFILVPVCIASGIAIAYLFVGSERGGIEKQMANLPQANSTEADKSNTRQHAPKIYKSEDGKFSIAFSEEPSIKDANIPSPTGPLNSRVYSVKAGDRESYMVSFVDFPKGTITDHNLEATYDGGRDGAAKNINGTILSEDIIAVGKAKLPGREFVFAVLTHDLYVRSRSVINGDRLYTYTVIGSKLRVESATSTSFLDSFSISE